MEEHDKIEAELERLGLDPKYRGRYWVIHCPFHDDSNKSAVCFNDGWIHCFAGCPRRHINSIVGHEVCSRYSEQTASETKQNNCDWTDLWLSLDTLQSPVKGVDHNVLNKYGWRWFPGGFGVPAGVFIPYFNEDRSRVEFFQVRHEPGNKRRFTFAPGCTPTLYGRECIKESGKYLCFTEGSRDSVILRMCGIPAVALPSASSGHLLRELAGLCVERRTILVAVSDRDDAGDKLLDNLDIPYLDMRTPVGKDVGDFYAEKGLDEVAKYYNKFRRKNDG